MVNELEEAAASTLRSALVDTITKTVPEYSIADTYDLKVDDIPLELEQLLDDLLEPSEPSTCLYPIVGADGAVVDFGECLRDSEEMGSSTASMSLNRRPFLENSTIKGSSSNLPFYPGGFGEALDNVLTLSYVNTEADVDDLILLETDEYLNCPPGFDEGVDLRVLESANGSESSPIVEAASVIDLETADIFDLIDLIGGADLVLPESSFTPTGPFDEGNSEDLKKDVSNVEAEEGGLMEIETVLEEAILTPDVIVPGLAVSGTLYHYALELPTNVDIPEYKKILPTMAKQYPFNLDPFQQAAVVCMENGESVFVAAHTSAGKTVVAEYAVALCKQHKTRAIYTSPIKALSNQKFRDFKILFDDVGLVTGDIQLNPEAFCLIMTTEILRSMLYNGSEVIRDLEWVVFDEVHYINNAERGHVWEEVLIMLPAHVKIVMLSATVPNCVEFADWVGRIKNRKINVVSTYKRPVPLEHYLYTGQDGKSKKDIFKVVDQAGQWLSEGYFKAIESKKKPQKQPSGAGHDNGYFNQGNRGGNHGNRGGNQGARGCQHGNRGGQQGGRSGQQGGRGGYQQNGASNRGGGGSGGFNGHGKNDKNVYINLIDYLRGLEQLPMVVFVFSRKRCDDYARLLESVDLTTAVEKSHVHRFFEDCVGRLKGGDKKLPQVTLMRELCMRGFAVHHSGILPILKEVVELLFQKGYVKILFATETFAMGVNMPARTVVFDSINKHDGTQMRGLNAGEYIQMAGRAGRRGLDTTGTVIVLAKRGVPEKGELETLMMGKASRLESQFRVTYSMLLNLLRVEQFKIEDMLQRSYVESASLRSGLTKKVKLDEMKEELSNLPTVQCSFCADESSSLQNYHDVLVSFIKTRQIIWPALFAAGEKLSSGRVVIISSAKYGFTNRIGVLIQDFVKSTIQVMIPCEEQEGNPDNIRSIVTSFNKLPITEQQWAEESCILDACCLFGLEGVSRPSPGQRFFCIIDDLPLSSLIAVCKKQLNKLPAVEIASEWKNRQLPRFRSNELPHAISKVIQDLDNLSENYASEGPQVSIPGIDMKVQDVLLFDEVDGLNYLRCQLLESTSFSAKHCSLFEEHMQILRERVRVDRKVKLLERELSTDSLVLSEDYRNRLKVLSAMGYVEKGNMVSLKGRVACEIHHMELLITELILENKLHNRSPAEVAALLSATTCQFKTNNEIKFEKDSVFEQLKGDVEFVRDKIDNEMKRLKVNISEVGDDVRYDLMPVVYNWANGMPFAEIKEMTEAQEGIIVRCIQRLGEVCKDVRNAARIVGDPALHEKMEQVSAAIKRDIVFAASLYHSM